MFTTKSCLLIGASLAVAMSENIMDFNNWNADNTNNIVVSSSSDATLSFSNSANGNEITTTSTVAHSMGSYCANINLQRTSGVVLSMYLTSGDPMDRSTGKWDELNFEFPYTYTSAGAVWINTWHNGLGAVSNAIVKVPNNINARYCITWNIGPGGVANWYIDGLLVNTLPLDTWTKPLMPSLTMWGAAPSLVSPLTDWTGVNQVGTSTVSAQVTKIYQSAQQENYQATAAPAGAASSSSTSVPLIAGVVVLLLVVIVAVAGGVYLYRRKLQNAKAEEELSAKVDLAMAKDMSVKGVTDKNAKDLDSKPQYAQISGESSKV